jgi:hypothetical protein
MQHQQDAPAAAAANVRRQSATQSQLSANPAICTNAAGRLPTSSWSGAPGLSRSVYSSASSAAGSPSSPKPRTCSSSSSNIRSTEHVVCSLSTQQAGCPQAADLVPRAFHAGYIAELLLLLVRPLGPNRGPAAAVNI